MWKAETSTPIFKAKNTIKRKDGNPLAQVAKSFTWIAHMVTDKHKVVLIHKF